MKLLILGHKGMLGHMVKLYLEQFYSVEVVESRWPSEDFKDTILNSDATHVINCIGAIPQKTTEFSVNFELPIWLDVNFKGLILHPDTDCKGQDPYSTSKSNAIKYLTERGVKTKIIKTSIIGPELSGNYSLMEWFLSQNSSVKGYMNHLWNGVTTLQWAKHAKLTLENWDKIANNTTIGSECISKWKLLTILNKVYNKSIQVDQHAADTIVDNCIPIIFTYSKIEDQLLELKEFYETRITK